MLLYSELRDSECRELPMWPIGSRISEGMIKATQDTWGASSKRVRWVQKCFQLIDLPEDPDRGRLREDRSWVRRLAAAYCRA